MKDHEMQVGDARNEIKPPPGVAFWKIAVPFLVVLCIGPGVSQALAALSLSATVEVHVKDAGTNAPIPDAVVQLDLDADGMFEPDQGEPMALTDAAGLAFFDPIVGVEDQDVRSESWHPTRVYLSRPAYRIGAGGEAVVTYALPEGFQSAHAAFHDLRGRRLGPSIPLPANIQGASVPVPLGHGGAPAADGVVFLVVQCDGRTSAVKLVNLSGGLEGVRLVGSSWDDAIELGWASGELVDIVNAEAKALKNAAKDASQDINVVVEHPDYQTAVQAETIYEGPNSIEIPMIPIFQGVEKTLVGDVWDITGSVPLDDAVIKLFNAARDSFITTADASGNFSVNYVVAEDGEMVKMVVEKAGYNTQQTGALLAQGRNVVVDGRIDAAASFPGDLIQVQPDTLTYASSDPRLDDYVRAQMASDAQVNDDLIRKGAGIVFNRDASYKTEILTNEFNGVTGESGDPIPAEHLGWFRTVSSNYQTELTQPNGTTLNDMVIVENATPSWDLANVHYVFMDTAHPAGNSRGAPNANGHLTIADMSVPQVAEWGAVMEEYIGAWATDEAVGNTGPYFTEDIALSYEGKVVHALHHLMDNGTNCDPE